jgi:hypothetical protein
MLMGDGFVLPENPKICTWGDFDEIFDLCFLRFVYSQWFVRGDVQLAASVTE